MAEQHSEHGIKFAGTVYARQPNGNWFDLGNTTSLKITASADKDERISKRKDSYGQALDNLPEPKPAEVSWENDTFNKRNFALMLMGSAADLDSNAQTITDAAVVLQKGVWVDLAHDNIDATQAVALVATEGNKAIDAADYVINYNLGMIKLAADSKIADNTKAKISYKTRAGGGYQIDAATLTGIDLELRVDGRNRATGEDGILSVWHVNVAADGDFDWLSGDWGKASFKGTCITPQGKNSPYRFKQFAA